MDILKDLREEKGWEKIGEYVEEKFFVNNVPESPNFNTLVKMLTYEESMLYDIGEAIGGIVRVYGVGFSIYRNRKTGEEFRVRKFFDKN